MERIGLMYLNGVLRLEFRVDGQAEASQCAVKGGLQPVLPRLVAPENPSGCSAALAGDLARLRTGCGENRRGALGAFRRGDQGQAAGNAQFSGSR